MSTTARRPHLFRWRRFPDHKPRKFLDLGDTAEYEIEDADTHLRTHAHWVNPGRWVLTTAAGSAAMFVLDSHHVGRWRPVQN